MYLRSYATRLVLVVWRLFLSAASLFMLAALALTFNPEHDLPRMLHDPFSVLWTLLNVLVFVGLYVGTLWLVWFARDGEVNRR